MEKQGGRQAQYCSERAAYVLQAQRSRQARVTAVVGYDGAPQVSHDQCVACHWIPLLGSHALFRLFHLCGHLGVYKPSGFQIASAQVSPCLMMRI